MISPALAVLGVSPLSRPPNRRRGLLNSSQGKLHGWDSDEACRGLGSQRVGKGDAVHRNQPWRRQNPHGVGYSGAQVVERKLTCPCCRTEFVWEGPEKLAKQQHTCTPCERHSYTPLSEELETLREHDQRLPGLVDKARGMARNAQRELAGRKQMDAERRAQVKSALTSRDQWRELLNAVEARHGPADRGLCGCGNKGCDVARTISNVRQEHRKRLLGELLEDDDDDFDEWLAARMASQDRMSRRARGTEARRPA